MCNLSSTLISLVRWELLVKTLLDIASFTYVFFPVFFLLILPLCVRQVDMRRPPRHNSAWPTATVRRPDRRWPPAGPPGRRRTGHRPCNPGSVPAVASRALRSNRTGPTTRWRRWWASPIIYRPGRRRAPAAARPARPVVAALIPRYPAVPGLRPEDLNIRQILPVCILTRVTVHPSITPSIYYIGQS